MVLSGSLLGVAAVIPCVPHFKNLCYNEEKKTAGHVMLRRVFLELGSQMVGYVIPAAIVFSCC
ncbi:TPA: hypothetical protein SUI30_000790 [Streptococcus equi subsp. equi]|uniref:hypothetical protein n=1 Tax=Streptococcus equi TaxID=1336 RepID=UPI000326C478|nr:hypothetical protein [Streptococcus equi]MCD3368758.1 hypothetical protein [Streptococcus equi subsp. zooepidemicus]MCD3384979.1 hypothetical protein [Streptococcus equi subsp. zooepidemicus]MCD3393358.1 hypothetical protein [Streptococcus equi subsp. zooepidemicus]MCD3448393.1 hypothetical protein [Streptococcus equi subsp. zooepidemicus]MCD3448398.1 hypothetical protein [Streptococcus equi subsp. zooepidemicus]